MSVGGVSPIYPWVFALRSHEIGNNSSSSSLQLSSNESTSLSKLLLHVHAVRKGEVYSQDSFAVLFLSMLGKQIEGEVEPCSTRCIHNEMRLHWSGYPEVMH